MSSVLNMLSPVLDMLVGTNGVPNFCRCGWLLLLAMGLYVLTESILITKRVSH